MPLSRPMSSRSTRFPREGSSLTFHLASTSPAFPTMLQEPLPTAATSLVAMAVVVLAVDVDAALAAAILKAVPQDGMRGTPLMRTTSKMPTLSECVAAPFSPSL